MGALEEDADETDDAREEVDEARETETPGANEDEDEGDDGMPG